MPRANLLNYLFKDVICNFANFAYPNNNTLYSKLDLASDRGKQLEQADKLEPELDGARKKK